MIADYCHRDQSMFIRAPISDALESRSPDHVMEEPYLSHFWPFKVHTSMALISSSNRDACQDRGSSSLDVLIPECRFPLQAFSLPLLPPSDHEWFGHSVHRPHVLSNSNLPIESRSLFHPHKEYFLQGCLLTPRLDLDPSTTLTAHEWFPSVTSPHFD